MADFHGHDFKPHTHPEIPSDLIGWECTRCTMFVMTEAGTTPETADRIFVSCGSFVAKLWPLNTCADYAKRS